MGLVAQHRVPHIIIVGGLHVVKEHHVLQLHGVAHHGVFAHDGAAPDEGAVAHLGPMVDDAGGAQVGRGKDFGVLGHPDPFIGLVILRRVQALAQLQDEGLDLIQHLPGVGLAFKQLPGDGFIQIKQVFDCYHVTSP